MLHYIQELSYETVILFGRKMIHTVIFNPERMTLGSHFFNHVYIVLGRTLMICNPKQHV